MARLEPVGRDLEGNRSSSRSTEPSSLGGESDLYRRIAKALHGRPRICSLLDQDGGTGVAQVVESKTIQSEGLDDRFEDSPVEVGVLRTDPPGEVKTIPFGT